MMEDVATGLKEFIENEMRSCLMDYGCITPEYVQRAWGGRVTIEDMRQLSKNWNAVMAYSAKGNKDARGTGQWHQLKLRV